MFAANDLVHCCWVGKNEWPLVETADFGWNLPYSKNETDESFEF